MSNAKELNEERARQLHAEHPVVLIHDHELVPDDLEACAAGGVCGKVMLPVMDAKVDDDPHASGPVLEGWADHARGEFAKAHAAVTASVGRAVVARCAEDVRCAHRGGRLAVIFGSEGGKLIEGSIDRLIEFHGLGLRYLQVAWNYPNQISKARYGKDSGLTAFGRELIPHMNRIGMIIDMTHAGLEAFQEALDLSTRPIMLSHGGAHGAIRRSRYPTWCQNNYLCFVEDDLLRELADRRGLLRISFVSALFHSKNGTTDIALADVADHCQYVAEKVGVDVLALGGDYFPVTGGWTKFLPKGYTGETFITPKDQLWRFTAHLLDRGWSEQDVAKVLGGNFLRFWEQVAPQVAS